MASIRPTIATIRLTSQRRTLHLTGPSTFSHLPPRPSQPIALHQAPSPAGPKTIDSITLPALFASTPDSQTQIPLLYAQAAAPADEPVVMKAQIHAQTPEAVSPVVEMCDVGAKMDFLAMAEERHGQPRRATEAVQEGVMERIIKGVEGVFGGGRVVAA